MCMLIAMHHAIQTSPKCDEYGVYVLMLQLLSSSCRPKLPSPESQLQHQQTSGRMDQVCTIPT